MKLIKVKNGYINANMIESYAVVEHETYSDIVAYPPTYTYDYDQYCLGTCSEASEAHQRLKGLAVWLTTNESGIFDIMALTR